ncbi:amidohydrolase family protein [Euzebya tangerina]|uniref:amidohydrolase family protein n=1 Tax=Euzebya tangerina TaxID=591198 RepID=UPI000E32402A|nr:amidohydrolase family protein [Euzebya tangerina]
MSDRFVIDGVCHPYNFAPENQVGRFGRIFTDVMHSYYPLVNDPATAFDRQAWEREWQTEEFMDTMLLESDTDICAVHTLPIYDAYRDGLTATDKGIQLKRDYPDRVLLYVGIDMFAEPEEIEAEAQMAVENGADGLKFYPSRYMEGRTETWPVDRMFPALQIAQDAGVTNIGWHKVLPIGPVSTEGMGVDDVSTAANVFPDLNFQVIHAGFMFIDETTFLIANHPNVYVTMEASMLLAILNPPKLQEILGNFIGFGGPHKVIYASAAVNPHPQAVIEAMENFQMPEGSPLQLTEEIRDMIMGGTLARLHGIDVEERAAALASDRFSTYKAEHGLRERWTAVNGEPANA